MISEITRAPREYRTERAEFLSQCLLIVGKVEKLVTILILCSITVSNRYPERI